MHILLPDWDFSFSYTNLKIFVSCYLISWTMQVAGHYKPENKHDVYSMLALALPKPD
jgi:hypothetical protein